MSVAVRTLCEFAARQGSIDTRYTPAPSADDGREAHKLLQQRRLGDYQAEHPLEGTINGLAIKGRADGYRPRLGKKPAELEEIKSHRGNVSKIPNARKLLHWAQIKVYGALLCQALKLKKVRLSLVYFDIDKDDEHRLSEIHSAEDLLHFTQQLCDKYLAWHQSEQEHRDVRDKGLSALTFCYEDFREGQRELAETCFKNVALGSQLLLEAPTGLGKTLGVLFPHLKAMPKHNIDRVFLLSNRNTGKTLWRDACEQLLDRQNNTIRVLQLDAKQQSCDNPELACHGESCPLAEGFFDRLPKAREEAAKQRFLSPDVCATIAREHNICRYFLAQEMSRWCDIVIADVNHYLDQQAILHALMQQNQWRASCVIDEAHNTIERARGMYSVNLDEQAFSRYKKNAPKALKSALHNLHRAFREVVEKHPEQESHHYQQHIPVTLIGQSQHFASKVAEYLVDNPGDSELQELMFQCFAFARLAETFDSHSICQIKIHKPYRDRYWRCDVSILNLDPSPFTGKRLLASHSATLFSATLKPFNYYADLLGLSDTRQIELPSPFNAEQIDLRLIDNIDTRFQARKQSAQKIADRIVAQFQQTPGNYLVFFPSFAYLKLIEAELPIAIPVVVQESRMDESARQQFIEAFKQGKNHIGMAVMGGIFGEGIDLPGEQLIGVYVISLGLPPFDNYHQYLAQAMQDKFGDGYQYTYTYPAVRKLIQAAGRLIRSPQDKGVIELIDPRIRHAEIQHLLPRWWFKKY